MTEHDKRYEGMTKQLNREYMLEWIKLVLVIVLIAASFGFTCWGVEF